MMKYAAVLLGFSLSLFACQAPQTDTSNDSPSIAPVNEQASSLSYKERFDEITEIVEEHFFDSLKIAQDFPAIKQKYRNQLDRVRGQRHFANLVRKLLGELQSSHTYYLSPSDVEYYWLGELFGRFMPAVQEVFKHQEVKYPSIGILTQKIKEQVFIASVLPGSPADSLGLLAGDEILGINGGLYAPVDSFWQYLDRDLKLTIRRSADSAAVDIAIQPELVNPKTAFLEAQKASIRLIEQAGKKIGYIHIYSYAGEEYHQDLIAAFTAGQLKEADALIIDLRYGLGGADFTYLDIFNPNVPSSTSKDRQGNIHKYDPKWRKPAVYLTNGATRSGKEVLAFGAKKFQLATVIGERTAGQVLGGRIFTLANGDLLYLAVREAWIDGIQLEGHGVRPDIEVPMDIRYSAGKDLQLEKAVDFLSSGKSKR